jgi:hypothetical protein
VTAVIARWPDVKRENTSRADRDPSSDQDAGREWEDAFGVVRCGKYRFVLEIRNEPDL